MDDGVPPTDPAGCAERPGAATPISSGASRTRTIAAVAGVVVVLAALIVALAVVRNSGSDTLPAQVRPSPMPSTGVDFIDSNGAYSIRVGDQWEAAQFADGAAWYTGTGDRRFRDNIVIIVEDLPSDLSLATLRRLRHEVGDASWGELRRAESHAHRVERRGDALVIDSFSEQQGFDLGHRLVVSVHDKVAVTITFTSERDRFDDSVSLVDEYLRTLSVR